MQAWEGSDLIAKGGGPAHEMTRWQAGPGASSGWHVTRRWWQGQEVLGESQVSTCSYHFGKSEEEHALVF